MRKSYIVLWLSVLCLMGECLMAQSVHPGLPFTASDIDQLKVYVTTEPWKTPYTSFKSKANVSYVPNPAVEVSRAPNIDAARNAWRADMTMAFNLSMVYAITGEEPYAAKARQILIGWATVNKKWSGDEDFLDLGDYADKFTTAADILKSTYPAWSTQDTELINSWFTNVLWPVVDVPNPTRGANQGAIQLKAAIGIAAFLQDPVKWQQAVHSLRAGAGGLANSLSNGQVGDSGRDEGHWRGQIEALSWCLEVVWKQGIDLYSELNNRMLAIGEQHAHFHLAPEDYTNQFILSGNTYGCYFNWGENGSNKVNLNTYEIVHNAYANRKGISTPYIDQFLQRPDAQVNENNFYYHKTSDNSTATPLPPLVLPSVYPTATLTNTGVGTTGLLGSAILNSGIWTVKGAGTGIPVPVLSASDGFEFAFQKQSGDVAIITKINSIQGAANARAGLLIRESLNADAKYVGIFINATGGTNSTWRGASAWSKTNLSWNNPPGGYLPHYCVSAPYWLKIERIGSRVSASHSPDAINWTTLAEVEIAMSPEIYLGLGVTSGNTSQLATATFSDLQISNSSPVGSPVITSATSASATLGSLFQYQITASENPGSFSASGLPDGLSINTNTGLISGTPTATGNSSVTLGASNGAGTGNAVLIIDVNNDVAPAAPNLVSVIHSGVDQNTLAWDASPNVTTYSIKRSLVEGGPYEVIAFNITLNSFIDIYAKPGINYYVITAFSGDLESENSNELSVEIPPKTPSKPSITSGNGAVVLAWPVAEGAVTYKVKRANVSGGPYAEIVNGLTSTNYTDPAVTNGVSYYYVISAMGITKESINSDEVLGLPGATSSIWKVNPATKLWSDANNWNGAVPASPSLVYFGPSESTSILQNDINDLTVARIIFSDSTYQMAGNQFVLSDGVENNSLKTQVFQMPVSLGNNVKMNTTGNVRFEGLVSGDHAINKTGSGTLLMQGLNSYSGGTIVHGGMVRLAGGQDGSSLGPLGSGPVILKDGSSLGSTEMTNTFLPNDVTVEGNVQIWNGWESDYLKLKGKLKGSGTITYDGSSYAGLELNGDNSEFTGSFLAIRRSSRQRCNFSNPKAGSARASWFLDANFSRDSQKMSFNGEIEFGAFSGGGTISSGFTPILKIGALNTDTEFSGQLLNNISLVKVGAGTFQITATNANTGYIHVNEGRVLVNGNGKITSVVTVNGGIFGGTGTSTADIIVGNGLGGQLTPGANGIGIFTTTGKTTFNQDGVFSVELNSSDNSTDQLITNGIVINNAVLNISNLGNASFAEGNQLTLVDNTSASAVIGSFNGLPQGAVVTIGTKEFRIAYNGGTGNDIVLIDNNAVGMLITSPTTSSSLIGESYQYTITATGNPDLFSATGLPVGLNLNTETGLISGTPTASGIFSVTITASNPTASNTATLTLTILVPSAPAGLSAAKGTGQVTLNWIASPDATSYHVKRAVISGGPYTVIATGITSTIYTDTDVTDGVTVFYVVSAVKGSYEGGNSNEVSVLPGDIYEWVQGPSSANWSTASNWISGVTPVNNAVLMFGSSSIANINNDLTFAASSLQFKSDAAAFTVAGNDFVLKYGIINKSVNAQTLNTNLSVTNLSVVDANAGNIFLKGLISGQGSIIKTGSKNLYLSGANTFEGGSQLGSGITYLAGDGTGTVANPLTGPLGKGTIVLNGANLQTSANTTLYNAIVVQAGTTNSLSSETGNLNIAGNIAGGGNINETGATGVVLTGDNSGFSGTFTSANRSGHRLRFNSPTSGSAAAAWILNNNQTDGNSFSFGNGTLHLGSLSGAGQWRSNGPQPSTTVVSIGALNTNTTYAGRFLANGTRHITITKVGTGSLTFTNAHTYTGATIVTAGTLLINGSLTSPITVTAGQLGGNGSTSSAVTVGTGSASGAKIAPGNSVGTFTTTAALILNSDATYALEINSTDGIADKIVAGSVTLNNAMLALSDLGSGTSATGTKFTIIENTGTAAVTGTFLNLPEKSSIMIGSAAFQISYIGGTGNDVVLTSSGALPVSLLFFKADITVSRKVKLTWATSEQVNASHFIVERSSDAKSFIAIGQIDAAGTTNGRNDYVLTDEVPLLGTGYYRLKQIDLDGIIYLYRVVSVRISEEFDQIVAPNPVIGDDIKLRFVGARPELQLTDLRGSNINISVLNSSPDILTIKAVTQLSSGIYILTARREDQVISHKVIVVK